MHFVEKKHHPPPLSHFLFFSPPFFQLLSSHLVVFKISCEAKLKLWLCVNLYPSSTRPKSIAVLSERESRYWNHVGHHLFSPASRFLSQHFIDSPCENIPPHLLCSISHFLHFFIFTFPHDGEILPLWLVSPQPPSFLSFQSNLANPPSQTSFSPRHMSSCMSLSSYSSPMYFHVQLWTLPCW